MINGVNPDKDPNQIHMQSTDTPSGNFVIENQTNLNQGLQDITGARKKIVATQGAVDIIDFRRGGEKQIRTVDADGAVFPIPDARVTNVSNPKGAYIIERPNEGTVPTVGANSNSSVTGDPHFNINGLKFDEQGKVNHFYSLYSGLGVEINALFSPSNPGTTVMSQIGIMSDNDKILLQSNGSGATLNGHAISQGKTNISNGTVSRNGNTVTVTTSGAAFTFTMNDGYINMTNMKVSKEGLGGDGVIPTGLAASYLNPQNRGHRINSDNFMVSGIFGTNNRNNQFNS